MYTIGSLQKNNVYINLVCKVDDGFGFRFAVANLPLNVYCTSTKKYVILKSQIYCAYLYNPCMCTWKCAYYTNV